MDTTSNLTHILLPRLRGDRAGEAAVEILASRGGLRSEIHPAL